MKRSSELATIVAAADARNVSDAAVIATDSSGTIVYWNDCAEGLYGWRADEAIGRNVVDVTPTRSSSDEAHRIMEELRQGHEWRGRFIVRRRDGTPLLADVTDVPVRESGAVIGIIGISRRADAGDPNV